MAYRLQRIGDGLAAEALGFFQQLYDLEDRARELSAEARQALRQSEAAPLLEKLRVWADEQAAQALPKLKFGEALGYLRNQWEPLTNYVQDGRLPIDNNAVERDLRALTIGRKNWLFIGSHEAGPRAAILYTVVASAADGVTPSRPPRLVMRKAARPDAN